MKKLTLSCKPKHQIHWESIQIKCCSIASLFGFNYKEGEKNLKKYFFRSYIKCNFTDVPVIAVTTDIFFFFTSQQHQSSQLWHLFLHWKYLVLFLKKKNKTYFHQHSFSSLPLFCYEWTSSHLGRIIRISYSQIFMSTIYLQSYHNS